MINKFPLSLHFCCMRKVFIIKKNPVELSFPILTLNQNIVDGSKNIILTHLSRLILKQENLTWLNYFTNKGLLSGNLQN